MRQRKTSEDALFQTSGWLSEKSGIPKPYILKLAKTGAVKSFRAGKVYLINQDDFYRVVNGGISCSSNCR